MESGHQRSRTSDLADISSLNLNALFEDEAIAILNQREVTPRMCAAIAQTQRLTAYYSVRLRLVQLPVTPLAHSLKLVHYLHWPDLIRVSLNARVPPQVRRAVDTQLLLRVDKLSLGEKVAAAKRCSAALIKVLLHDPNPLVFASLLLNQRLREEDLLVFTASETATPEKLQMLGGDRKWSYRYAIRRAIVLHPATPHATAASQLRFLSRRDLRLIHDDVRTTTYVRRCIERLLPALFAHAE